MREGLQPRATLRRLASFSRLLGRSRNATAQVLNARWLVTFATWDTWA